MKNEERDPKKVRNQRQRVRDLGDRESDFKEDNLDDDFLQNADQGVRKSEKTYKQQMKVQSQINYFGYHIEPFNMKNEREEREIDQDGNFLFNKKREQNKTDTWLDQLDEEEAFTSVYMNRKREKGVYSDDDDDDEEPIENFGDDLRKKVKKNPNPSSTEEKKPSKYDNLDKVELLSALCSLLEQEVTFTDAEVTPAVRMHRLKKQQNQSEKPVFPFKKNMRQKEREEQEKKIAEWESSRLSEEQLKAIKTDLDDLIDLVKEIETAFELSDLWNETLEKIKSVYEKENAKKEKELSKRKQPPSTQMNMQVEEEEEEDVCEEDLKMVPKELLEKLDAGTINEEEGEEVKRIINIARMKRKSESSNRAAAKSDNSDSDSDDIVLGNIQFDSDEEEENEDDKKEQENEIPASKTTERGQFKKPNLPPIDRTPISQQGLSKPNPIGLASTSAPATSPSPAFRAPAPMKKQPAVPARPASLASETTSIATDLSGFTPDIAAIIQKAAAEAMAQPGQEVEIEMEKPKKAPVLSNNEDDFDMFG